jgi:hypothetical protein
MKNEIITKAMEEYTAGEKTLEETNAILKEAGAGFHLTSLTDEERAAKKFREDEEGTIDIGRTPEILPNRPDMRRRTDLAGQTVIQRTKRGRYEVKYSEHGYAIRAKKV